MLLHACFSQRTLARACPSQDLVLYAGLSAVPAQPVRFGRGDKRKRCSPRGLHRILHRGSRSVASTQAGYGRIRLTQIYRFPFLLRLASLADDHSGAGSGNNRGVGQAKAVVFFILVAVIGLIQLQATRKKEVQQ